MARIGLGDRMKEYEAVFSTKLVKRMPVVIRLDGCAFRSFTRGLNKPFDEIFIRSMQQTTEALCRDIQGCVFGYVQSDEISLILVDYKNLDSDCWYDNKVQKICSVAASKASRYFNQFFISNVAIAMKDEANKGVNFTRYTKKFFTADFDCRAFNVPVDDVCNCIIWRQRDAERNSIQMLAQSLFRHNEIVGISCKQLQNKMFTEKGVNWNDLSTHCKRGSACKRDENGKWYIDNDMPILTDNRAYIEDLIRIGE